MGYLVCQNCKGYYELEEDEKPEDFDDECECGGILFFLDSDEQIDDDLLFNETIICPFCGSETPIIANFCGECGENIVTLLESVYDDEYTDEDKSKKKGKSWEEYQAFVLAKAKREAAESVSLVHEVLDEHGYYISKGGSGKFIALSSEGIEIKGKEFFYYDEIESATLLSNKSNKIVVGLVFFTPLALYASSKKTIQILLKNQQEIRVDDVKKKDAFNCVSYINRRISNLG
ncbi:zinc ribbon domain-containing protein [Methanobacterium ferruginis]|uniref:zinc ribbon domain-containing protein n=1 Tax=Methanobacterium ferruginis TaxID=710191 RepID=UPI002573FE17|nr:zinc ribbon domain-containing protein [Methanobacterium ferruginis]BDZ68605.1 hypothetical protein GCM10025860_20530 [Methanobacterium ferruginis]